MIGAFALGGTGVVAETSALDIQPIFGEESTEIVRAMTEEMSESNKS